MVNENIIPKTETVAELKEKYEIPNFEEFMQSYKSDANLNYDDLNGDDISEVKGYGPCSSSSCSYKTNFYLKIGFSQNRLFNWHFREGDREFGWIICENIEQARAAEEKVRDGTYRVVGATGGSDTIRAGNKKTDVLFAFQIYVPGHKNRGENVNEVVDLNEETLNLFADEGKCSIN